MEFNKLGDWCKWLEKNFSPEIAIPKLPVILRLDGVNFSKFTKRFEKPFDSLFSKTMIDTVKFLCEETNAVVGYTQSDEITLILYSPVKEKAIYHNGKKQKILSKLTSKASNFFNKRLAYYFPNNDFSLAEFDCRIYQTPTVEDAANQLLWRELDAERNSIQSLGHAYFSTKQLHGKNSTVIKGMLKFIDVDWLSLPDCHRKGTYIKRVTKTTSFSKEELEKLPPKHKARQNPDCFFQRTSYEVKQYPNLSLLKNRAKVIFFDEECIIQEIEK